MRDKSTVLNDNSQVHYLSEKRKMPRKLVKGGEQLLQLDWTSNTSRQKNQFANEPEGLRHFQDHRWKALVEENPDLLCIFFSDHFLTS